MNARERVVEAVLTMEDAAYIRRERLAGDPSRNPDETTLEDVTEALMRRKAPAEDFTCRKWIYLNDLRALIRHGIDLTD